MELSRYCYFTHFTGISATSGRGHSTTIAQTPKVNHQHIMRVWHSSRPGAPTSQGWWRSECSSTKGQWRSQCSLTPKGNFCGSETAHAGNRIHKDSLANHFRWKVLDGWRSLETRDWSTGSSAVISRCSCWYTICVSIAWWSISYNQSANPRSCKCLFRLLLPDWTSDNTKPRK